jgi:hypothetical protein
MLRERALSERERKSVLFLFFSRNQLTVLPLDCPSIRESRDDVRLAISSYRRGNLAYRGYSEACVQGLKRPAAAELRPQRPEGGKYPQEISCHFLTFCSHAPNPVLSDLLQDQHAASDTGAGCKAEQQVWASRIRLNFSCVPIRGYDVYCSRVENLDPTPLSRNWPMIHWAETMLMVSYASSARPEMQDEPRIIRQ